MFDQRHEDPQGFYLSLAVICGLLAAGMMMTGGTARPIGFLVAIGAAVLFWRSSR